jgi:monothiol glutaredoxin
MTNVASVDDAQAHIAETIKAHPIVLFMKGNLSRPQCGFSAAVVQVLGHYGVLYVDGTFIGGCDIVLEMHASGELAQTLAVHRAAPAS